MVRAKFMLTEIRQVSHSTGQTLLFQAQYDPNIPEDRSYSQATPSGKLEMFVNNPSALGKFALGKSYYLDFSTGD